jgi:hypothetical protein
VDASDPTPHAHQPHENLHEHPHPHGKEGPSLGMEKYDRAIAEFDGPEFELLLEEVVCDD